LELDGDEKKWGFLKLGLYGNNNKDGDGSSNNNSAVEQITQFLSPTPGLLTPTTTKVTIIGQRQEDVLLARGGEITDIVPQQTIEFGVPSQTNAYARSKGRAKVDDFLPQAQPQPLSSPTTMFRPHDQAGLISAPEKGLGYSPKSTFESDDACCGSAFVLTAADATPALDKERRIVVGQVLDAPSMAFLQRLANLPTQRGIRGVLPCQTSGPPLPKVVVRAVQVADVKAQP